MHFLFTWYFGLYTVDSFQTVNKCKKKSSKKRQDEMHSKCNTMPLPFHFPFFFPPLLLAEEKIPFALLASVLHHFL